MTRRRFFRSLAIVMAGISIPVAIAPWREYTYIIDYDGSGRTVFKVPLYEKPPQWPDWVK